MILYLIPVSHTSSPIVTNSAALITSSLLCLDIVSYYNSIEYSCFYAVEIRLPFLLLHLQKQQYYFSIKKTIYQNNAKVISFSLAYIIILYQNYIKGTTAPYKGLAMKKIETPPFHSPKYTRVVFLRPFPGLYRKTLLTINKNKGK